MTARLILILFVLACAHAAAAASPRNAEVKPAIDGIFAAFASRPLVGLGDRHNLAQGHLFYEALIRDARFARDVGNVVVEFGSARHQGVLDRYVNGEPIPYAQLRRVWMDTPGFIPTVDGAYFAHFFYQVRRINADLPPAQRIKVWLGGSPVEWEKVQSREQLALAENRDRFTARLILDEILARQRRALVIYGAYHFEPVDARETSVLARWAQVDPQAVGNLSRSLQKLVEERHPQAFFVAQIYTGFGDAACTAEAENAFDSWPRPALVTPLLGSTVETALRRCLPPRQPATSIQLPPGIPDFVKEYVTSQVDDHVIFRGDALLYLGKSADLTLAPRLPDIYLDEEYRTEIARRFRIMTGQDLPPDLGRNLPESMRFMQRDQPDGTSR